MALPINIEELLQGRVIEWERIEFKEGWNPEAVLHTICAFANDVNNWGGGYIVIGIAEKDGLPVFPPVGLSLTEITKIQKELLNLCHKMKPTYFPTVEVVNFQKQSILVIWVHGGVNRPYKAPVSLAKKPDRVYYIRRYASTKKATESEERSLMSLANNIPFDDRINHSASLDDLNITLIQEYLTEIHSALAGEAAKIPFHELCLKMNIATGPVEQIKPKNIGLLLFNDSPEKIFPYTRIDVVEFEDEVGDAFSEKIFTGPVHQQVRAALRYLKNKVITEYARKIPDRAEAERFFNYPYGALEEIVVNAVYHRSYEQREPVEIRVMPNRIEVLSYPGPTPPIDNKMLKKQTVIARIYRNRRIGDFLKELDLTEGRSTGFPKIRRAMKFNGSPPPVFETNKNRDYFLAILPIHPKAKKKAQVEPKVGEQIGTKSALSRHQVGTKLGLSHEEVKHLLSFCSTKQSISNIQKEFKWSDRTKFRNKYINPLLQEQLLEMTIPDKPQSSKQKYKTTDKGLALLKNE